MPHPYPNISAQILKGRVKAKTDIKIANRDHRDGDENFTALAMILIFNATKTLNHF